MKKLIFLALAVLAVGVASMCAQSLAGLPGGLAGATTTNVNLALPIQQGAGLAVQGGCTFTDATTSNAVYTFYITADGTNYLTAPWATITIAGNGTNTTTWGTNWSAAALAGWRTLKLGSVQNTHESIPMTNLTVWYSFGPF